MVFTKDSRYNEKLLKSIAELVYYLNIYLDSKERVFIFLKRIGHFTPS